MLKIEITLPIEFRKLKPETFIVKTIRNSYPKEADGITISKNGMFKMEDSYRVQAKSADQMYKIGFVVAMLLQTLDNQ